MNKIIMPISIGIIALVVGVLGYFLNLLDKDFKQRFELNRVTIESQRLEINIKLCRGYTGQDNPNWNFDKDNKFVCYQPQPSQTPTPKK